MAIIRHSSFDKTVNTIADRNAIANKVNHMTVLVKDAIADTNAGTGKATYRWDATDNSWVIVSRSNVGTISFITEELIISNGEVQLSNYPLDNQLWNIAVLDGDILMAEIRLNELSITNGNISGLLEYNGLKLKATYGYGSMKQQVEAVIDSKITIYKQPA